MTALEAALVSYRAEVQRLGPVLARVVLWREADRRAHRIADRIAPHQDHGRGFTFHHGGAAFAAVQRSNARAAHRHLLVLEYARDQILAKLERRARVAQAIGELA